MSVNANVNQALDRHLRNVTCLKYNGETLASNGEATDAAYVSSTKSMALLPLTQDELRIMPQGLYDSFDRKAYTKDVDDILPNESKIVTDFGTFKVINRDNRYYEGGFIVYYTKKVQS